LKRVFHSGSVAQSRERLADEEVNTRRADVQPIAVNARDQGLCGQ
jgi:hypothetical protein